ncbi:hypothetical protein Q8A67_021793 [Cirrhinus molitorella]|uniref:Uncharacterized protein n=1 Tax=Cirrhinus molitorella TaxID=172907 RepID=A0AA88PBF5_9TELE|nr:hypothetical protein Q8A67_021793 [Cirrhinus molitorella]
MLFMKVLSGESVEKVFSNIGLLCIPPASFVVASEANTHTPAWNPIRGMSEETSFSTSLFLETPSFGHSVI